MTHSEQIVRVRRDLTADAMGALEAVGGGDEMISSDLVALETGTSAEALLATCLHGAEGASTVAGWRQYVAAVDRWVGR